MNEAFPRASVETRTTLAQEADVRTYRMGRTILDQGDETSLALILDGHVAFRRDTVDGQQLIVRIGKGGELAAILPLVDRPTAVGAIALTEASVAIWRAKQFREIAASDPGFAADLLGHVLGKFEEVVGRLDGLLHQQALRRVARVLDLYADLFFSDPPVLRRTHLPALVGTSREMTGRVMRSLESKGLVVRVGRDRLDLLDRAGLAAAAQSSTR